MVAASIATALMLALLLYGHVSPIAIAALCAVVFAAAALASHRRHRHGHDLMGIDALAHESRLSTWNAGLKTCLCISFIVLCIASDSLLVAATLFVGMSAASLWSSGMGLARYCSFLAVPLMFVSLGGIVLLIDVSATPCQGLSIPFFQWYACVTPQTQAIALMVVAKALSSLACLYALALSTPVYEIAGFLRRAHVPAVAVDLAVLIYRYISILANSLRKMTTAAQTRLGENSYRALWRSCAGIASNLFVRSFFHANRNFDALEARSCANEIRFDIEQQPLNAAHIAAGAGCFAIACAAILCERAWM